MTIARILDGRADAAVVTAAPDMTIGALVALLAARRIGAVPVVDGDGRVAGVASERDVIHALADHGAAALDWPVARGMTAPAITATRDLPIVAALSLMTRRRIRHLPVVAGERLVGIVSIGDLVKSRIDRIESEARAMRDYIQTA